MSSKQLPLEFSSLLTKLLNLGVDVQLYAYNQYTEYPMYRATVLFQKSGRLQNLDAPNLPELVQAVRDNVNYYKHKGQL